MFKHMQWCNDLWSQDDRGKNASFPLSKKPEKLEFKTLDLPAHILLVKNILAYLWYVLLTTLVLKVNEDIMDRLVDNPIGDKNLYTDKCVYM